MLLWVVVSGKRIYGPFDSADKAGLFLMAGGERFVDPYISRVHTPQELLRHFSSNGLGFDPSRPDHAS